MYREQPSGNPPVVSPFPKTGRWHELAKSIRKGCLKRPIQCFGHLVDGPGTACVVGASMVADYMGGYLAAACPACGTYFGDQVLFHLNDFHRWPREQIADWLDTL